MQNIVQSKPVFYMLKIRRKSTFLNHKKGPELSGLIRFLFCQKCLYSSQVQEKNQAASIVRTFFSSSGQKSRLARRKS